MSDLAAALDGLQCRQDAYRLARAYYAGDHDTGYISDKYKSAFIRHFKQYRKNFCPRVVNALRDRLRVTGFVVTAGPESAAATVDAIWQANRMDQGQSTIHREALLLGDAYLIVWPDGPDPALGRVRLDVQIAEQMTLAWDPEAPQRLLWAAKAWPQADGTWRLTLYYPDRLEKYVTARKVSDGTWPKPGQFVEWAPPLRHEYGQVPVFHWANDARPGQYGTSQLHDIIPLQDDLNKISFDRITAMEVQALPQRWLVGFDPEIDSATGQPINPFRNEPGSIWHVKDPNSRFGEFSAAALDGFLKTETEAKADIARISGTPPHFLLLSGDFPSGEALHTAEAPFVAQISDRQTAFGNVWEDALSFALRVAGQAGVTLESQWAPAAQRSDLEAVAVAQGKAAVGVPEAVLWQELGYTPDEVTKMEGQAATAAERATALAFVPPPGLPTEPLPAVPLPTANGR